MGVGAVPALALTGILVWLLLFLLWCYFLDVSQKCEPILHVTLLFLLMILGLHRIIFNRNGSDSMGCDVRGTPPHFLSAFNFCMPTSRIHIKYMFFFLTLIVKKPNKRMTRNKKTWRVSSWEAIRVPLLETYLSFSYINIYELHLWTSKCWLSPTVLFLFFDLGRSYLCASTLPKSTCKFSSYKKNLSTFMIISMIFLSKKIA